MFYFFWAGSIISVTRRLTRKARVGRPAFRHPIIRKLVRSVHSGRGLMRLRSPTVPSSAESTGSVMSPAAAFIATRLARF